MKLRDIYAQPGLTLSVEFFPPKTPKGDADLFREVEVLKTLNPAFCSVTYGAGGSTHEKTVELVTSSTTSGARGDVPPDGGRPVQGRSARGPREAQGERHREHHRPGRRSAAGGHRLEGAPRGFHHSAELVAEAAAHDCFSIAVAGFPEVHPRAESRETDLRYLKKKVDAGADAVITQLFFDNDDYYRYVEDVRRVGVDVPIVPGVLPIQSTAQTRRFTAMCASKIPPRLEPMLAKVENDNEAAIQLGIDYATEQCEGLIRFGVPGIHFYSLNKSRSVMAISKNLSLTTIA